MGSYKIKIPILKKMKYLKDMWRMENKDLK